MGVFWGLPGNLGQSQTLTLSPDAMYPLGGTCVSRSPLSFVSLWGTVSKQQWCRVQRGSKEAAGLGRPQLLCPLATSLVQSGLCCCLSFEAGTPETCSGQVGPAFGFVCARTLEGGHDCRLCSRYISVGLVLDLGAGSCCVASEKVGKSQDPSTKTLTPVTLPTFCPWPATLLSLAGSFSFHWAGSAWQCFSAPLGVAKLSSAPS